MSRIQNVAIAVLFIISTVSAQGPKLKDSNIDINNQTDPIPSITEINNNITDSTEPPKGNNTTVSPTTTSTIKTTIPTEKTTTTTVAPNSTTTIASTTPTTPATTPPPITSTTTTTTLKPNVTTGAPPTTPVPSHRRFDGPSFIGGIVLALGLVAIGFVAFKFYKARTELNYHTL